MGTRSKLAAVAAAALAVVGWYGGKSLLTEAPPSEPELERLCEESYQTAHERLSVAGEPQRTEGEYFLTAGDTSVVCEGGAWTVELAGPQTVGVEMDLVFYTDEDPAGSGDDYCDTTGTGHPVHGSEERRFHGHPYCFWWWHGDARHTGTATYFDRGIKVVLQWHISTRGNPFDASSDIGSPFFATNDAVLSEIYEGFRQE